MINNNLPTSSQPIKTSIDPSDKIQAQLTQYQLNQLLIESIKNNDLQKIQYYIELGANIHQTDHIPLQIAAENNQLAIVQYLVEHGADVNASSDSDNAIWWATMYGYLDIVKYMVEQGVNIHSNENILLRTIVQYGDLSLVQFLVESGADIHAKDNDALIKSMQYNKFEVVEYLLKKGANIHTQNEAILTYAIKNNLFTETNILLEYGANPRLIKIDTIKCSEEMKLWIEQWLSSHQLSSHLDNTLYPKIEQHKIKL